MIFYGFFYHIWDAEVVCEHRGLQPSFQVNDKLFSETSVWRHSWPDNLLRDALVGLFPYKLATNAW